jgi:hypothetical protein
MSKCILPPLYIHILATYTPVYCMSTTVQQRNATQNKLAKHFSNLNNLSLRQNSLFSTPQYLQGSKDSLKGLQMSTIVLERHRSGGHFCLFLYRSHLCYLGFYPTRTVSCEMDYLDRCRSISTHLSHCNLEFFDYSVVKVRENKKPEKHSLSSLAVISNLVIFACRKAASHAPIGVTKLPRENLPGLVSLITFAKVFSKVQSLVSRTSKHIVPQNCNHGYCNL